MAVKIKWYLDSYWEQRLILGGEPFNLTANWNVRDESWNVYLYTGAGEPLIVGRKLVLNTNILAQVQSSLVPKGQLIVVAVSKKTTEITRNNMGIDVELMFLED
jgi:hypothetical protein